VPCTPTADLVAAAVATGRGLGAFNVITLEHAEAVVDGAAVAGQPVVLQISENAVRFHGGRLAPIAAACRALAEKSIVDAALHLDHAVTYALLEQARGLGFGSAMVDTTGLPYAENVEATRRAVAYAHRHGLWLESELGTVGGKEGVPPPPAHAPEARTDPATAASYVDATGVDGLAVAVGSVHAMTTRTARLDHALIAALRNAVPVPLVLHGSSGVPDDELRQAVEGGIVKVNIGTALNVAYTGAVRERVHDVVDPRRYLDRARDAMAERVAHLLTVLATAAR